jgi:hypothetical protein
MKKNSIMTRLSASEFRDWREYSDLKEGEEGKYKH